MKPLSGFMNKENVIYVLGLDLNVDILHHFYLLGIDNIPIPLVRSPSDQSNWIKLITPVIDKPGFYKLHYKINVAAYVFEEALYEIKTASTSIMNLTEYIPKINTNSMVALPQFNSPFHQLFSETFDIFQDDMIINRRDRFGATVLFWVVFIEDVERVKFILEHKGNPNISTFTGEYPLHIAVLKNNIVIMNELIRYGADVNVVNVFLETPLFYAYRYDLKQTIELLENSGADRNRRNIMGKTCIDYIKKENIFNLAKKNVNQDKDKEQETKKKISQEIEKYFSLISNYGKESMTNKNFLKNKRHLRKKYY